MTVIYNNMTEYHIYKIKSPHTDTIYIGSTKQTLTERLSGHKSTYKKWLKDNTENYITSFEILKFNDYVIELIETFTCETNKEKLRKEGEHIKLNQLICVNKVIAGRTNTEYRYDNRYKICDQKWQWRQDNRQLLFIKTAERCRKKLLFEEQIQSFYDIVY